MKEYITEKEYWDDFWEMTTLPQTVDYNFSNDRVIADFVKKNIPAGFSTKKALEIGCAPGKWMVFLAKELDYVPEGCEYLRSAVITTEKNLTMNGLNDPKIHEGDFLKFDFGEQKYDLVLSLGFIEHFADPESVIEKMTKILNHHGILVIGIPKFSGINYFFAKQVDRTIKNKLLPRHNLKIMNCNFFREISNIFSLKPIKISCVGAFEPALYDISNSPLWFKGIFHLSTLLFNNRLCRTLNAEFYSSYILAAYQKT
jgi:2-polyprenyl-3-methyl-5-hydroxy-6-metoxy-1,4-benzoquinol methylase